MKLSWLFHPFPLLWYDSIITRYILDRRSRLISPSGRTSDQNQLLLLERRNGHGKKSILSFRFNLSPPFQIFSTAKRSRESFPLYEIIHREGKTKKEKWLNFILVFIYRCAFQFCNNFQYRIFPRSMDEFGWIFSREFFHSLKEILCPLIIISIYPISRNYKIPFRFALFERKSFLTILRNF